jgi:hypothetical protein
MNALPNVNKINWVAIKVCYMKPSPNLSYIINCRPVLMSNSKNKSEIRNITRNEINTGQLTAKLVHFSIMFDFLLSPCQDK